MQQSRNGRSRSHRTTGPSRARDVAQLNAELRQHRCDISRWALSQGRPLNIDALSSILGAKLTDSTLERREFARWVSKSIVVFLHASVPNWCHANSVDVPQHLAESLFTYVSYLHHHNLLAPGSSASDALFETIVEFGCLSKSGRSLAPQRQYLATLHRLCC